MLHPLEEHTIMCPYCGENFTILIDCSVSDQSYIEDCEVCCCPIEIHGSISETDEIRLTVATGNE